MKNFLKQIFGIHEKRVLLRLPDGTKRTYGEIWKKAGMQQYAWKYPHHLHQEKIALFHPNSERWLIEALSIWIGGGQVIPLSFQEKQIEPKLNQVRPNIVSLYTERFPKQVHKISYPNQNNTPLVLFTSGSSGQGKKVEYSTQNILSNLEQIDAVVDQDMVNQDDISFAMLPWSHSYGLTCELLFLMKRGASLYIPDPKQSLTLQLRQASPTLLYTVPYFLEKCVRVPWWMKKNPQQIVGERLKSVSVGGAPCSASLIQSFESVFGTKVYQGYGTTETSPMISLNTNRESRHGSVGKVLPEIKIRISGEGEILVAGPNVVQTLPEERYERIGDTTFLKTGDTGHLDTDGFLFIEERLVDNIKLSNGLFVNASFIERIYHDEFSKKFKIDKTVLITPNGVPVLVLFSSGFHPHWIFPWIKRTNDFQEFPDWYIPCLTKIGKSHHLKKHEIPQKVFWARSSLLPFYCTPKFTIKRQYLESCIPKH